MSKLDPVRRTFDAACDAMIDAIARVRTDGLPDEVRRIADVMFQCDALKATALAAATRIDFISKYEKDKKKP